ncbi:MAG: hypothetical protein V4574_00650 [Pseudomonadota bacterium]
MLLYAAALLLSQDAPCPPLDASKLGAFAAWPVHYDSLEPGTAVTRITGDATRLKDLPPNDRKGSAAMVMFSIRAVGPYEIATDQPGWIDLLPGFDGATTAVEPASHRHGEACSPLRKILRFDLKPGVYRLYLSGLATREVRVMLVAGE